MSAIIRCFQIYKGRRVQDRNSLPTSDTISTRPFILLPNGILLRRVAQPQPGQPQFQRVQTSGPFIFQDITTDTVCIVIPRGSSFNGDNNILTSLGLSDLVGQTVSTSTSLSGILSGGCPVFKAGINPADIPAAKIATPCGCKSKCGCASNNIDFTNLINTGTSTQGVNIQSLPGGGTIINNIQAFLQANPPFQQFLQTNTFGGITIDGLQNANITPNNGVIFQIIRAIIKLLVTQNAALGNFIAQDSTIELEGAASKTSVRAILSNILNRATASSINCVSCKSDVETKLLAFGSNISGAAINNSIMSTGRLELEDLSGTGIVLPSRNFFFIRGRICEQVDGNFVTVCERNGADIVCAAFQNIVPSTSLPVGIFSCRTCINLGSGSDQPGTGLGAAIFGAAIDRSRMKAAGNGSFVAGTAIRCESCLAAGQASQAFGRNVKALAPYSMAMGLDSFAYMQGQLAHSSARPGINTNLTENCPGACQYSRVLLKSDTTVTFTAAVAPAVSFYTLTTTLVLGDSPRVGVITLPNGTVIDRRHLPFLQCAGTALVNIEIVTPGLSTTPPLPVNFFPPFGVSYCFTVTRVDCVHIVSPLMLTCGPPPILEDALPNGITVTAMNGMSICAGFAIIITEIVPVTITLPGPIVVPNPRINPNPPPVNGGAAIQNRLYCATLKMTFQGAGSSTIIFTPTAIVPRRLGDIQECDIDTTIDTCGLGELGLGINDSFGTGGCIGCN